MKELDVIKVSVPDYGELILNCIMRNVVINGTKFSVSVPDYGELILNRVMYLTKRGTIMVFPSPITGN